MNHFERQAMADSRAIKAFSMLSDGSSYSDLAKELGVTRERARQIVMKGEKAVRFEVGLREASPLGGQRATILARLRCGASIDELAREFSMPDDFIRRLISWAIRDEIESGLRQDAAERKEAAKKLLAEQEQERAREKHIERNSPETLERVGLANLRRVAILLHRIDRATEADR